MKFLVTVSLLFALMSCAHQKKSCESCAKKHHEMKGHQAKWHHSMNPAQHEKMAKIHGEAAACLKKAKSDKAKSNCMKTLKMSHKKMKKAHHHKKKHMKKGAKKKS